MKNLSGRSLQILTAIFTSFLVFAFADLARNGFISDSEIWAVTIAKNFREEWYQPWVFSRLFFYAPMAAATAFFHTATSIFDAAKAVMLLNGLFILFFTYRLSRRLSSHEGIGLVTPYLAVLFTLANSGFLNQGYRIRSDLISCTFVLLALEITFREKGRLPPKKLLYWALPFLATPKAALHVFPAVSFLERKRILLIISLGFFLTVLIFPSSIKFFLGTYTNHEGPAGFFSEARFIYLNRMLTHNGSLVFIFALRFVLLITRLKLGAFESDRHRTIQVEFCYFILGSVIVLVIGPDKVPFFIAAFIPIFSVFASLGIDDILAILKRAVPPSRRKGHLVILISSIALFTTAVTFRAALNWKSFRENNSSTIQMTLIRTLETYLSYYPKATYYDVVGLVPQRASIRLFAGPHDQVANRNSMLTLEHVYKPDLIFMVRKINYLKPDIKELIKKDYFPIGASAFGRWRKLDTPLKLPLKNQSELDPLLAQMKQWSGAAELREFTALVETKGKPSRTLQLSPKDLLNRKIVGPRSQLTAISPFTKIDRMTDMLPEIIRFDWDWTGTTDLVDDIPNEELLLKE